MSFNRLLSRDRKLFVQKVYNEMNDNSLANIHGRQSRKAYFLRLVERNDELSEIEKQYCRERKIYSFELNNAEYKWGEPRECDKCQTTRYSDKYCEWCISLHLQNLFNTWTSGNEIIDNFIHKCQIQLSLPQHILEWIPFDQFIKIEKLTEGRFSSIYTATWTRGSIIDYDEYRKEFTYFGPEYIVLKCLNNSSNPGKAFFNEVINQLSKLKLTI